MKRIFTITKFSEKKKRTCKHVLKYQNIKAQKSSDTSETCGHYTVNKQLQRVHNADCTKLELGAHLWYYRILHYLKHYIYPANITNSQEANI